MLVNIKCWCFNPGYLSTKQKRKTSLPYLGTCEVISDDSNGILLCLQFTILCYSSKNTFFKLVFIITECKCSFL